MDVIPMFGPRWVVQAEALKLEILVGSKTVHSFDIPLVVDAYTGDTRERVLREEVAKLKDQHRHVFGQLQYAWQLSQALTARDKAYIHAHQVWRIEASVKGVDDPAVKRMYAELESLGQGVSPAGWHALSELQKKAVPA